MTRPELRVTSVTIGTSQPVQLAQFYATLLGWPVTRSYGPRPGEPEGDGWAQVAPPPHVTGPRLNFEFERQFQRPVWPSRDGEQTASQHLDIHVDDLDAAVAWAESCGARLAGFQPQERVRVMVDPDGHPFCLYH